MEHNPILAGCGTMRSQKRERSYERASFAAQGCYISYAAMPTVFRERGYRFHFYTGEGNEPAHVHVEKGSGRLKFWLPDMTIARSRNFKPAEIREILNIARTRRKLLLDTWNEFARRKD